MRVEPAAQVRSGRSAEHGLPQAAGAGSSVISVGLPVARTFDDDGGQRAGGRRDGGEGQGPPLKGEFRGSLFGCCSGTTSLNPIKEVCRAPICRGQNSRKDNPSGLRRRNVRYFNAFGRHAMYASELRICKYRIVRSSQGAVFQAPDIVSLIINRRSQPPLPLALSRKQGRTEQQRSWTERAPSNGTSWCAARCPIASRARSGQ